MGDPIYLAAFQGKAVSSDIRANLTQVEKQCVVAASRNAHLVAFPELFLTGYDIGSAELSRLAIEGTIERGVLQQVALTAQRNRIAILIPYPELVMNGANRVVYNSAALIDHTGRLVTNYRKTHLWSNYEKDVFTEGSKDELKVVELPLRPSSTNSKPRTVKVGILICYDIEFPEPVRTLRLKGMELLLVPTAISASDKMIPHHFVQVRACENQVFLVYSNLHSLSNGPVPSNGSSFHTPNIVFAGCSAIVSPTGQVLARAGVDQDELLVAKASWHKVEEQISRCPYMLDRRPSIYSCL